MPDSIDPVDPLPAPAADTTADSSAAAPTRQQERLKFWRDNMTSPRRAWRTVNEFSEELRRDPSFWPHIMAMRGGLVMTGMAVAVTAAYGMTLPFAMAATAVVGAGVIAGAATIGVVAGSRFAWTHVRRALHIVKHGDNAPPLPPKPPRALPEWLEKMGDNKIIKAIGESAQWKQAGALINSQKKWMLGGTALGGSALTAGMGVWMLAAQAVVVPVVVLGTAVSVAALWAVASIVTGCVGLYFGTTSLLRWHRETKQAKAEAKADAAAVPGVAAASTPTGTAPCREGFAAAQAKGVPLPDVPATAVSEKKRSRPAPGQDKV